MIEARRSRDSASVDIDLPAVPDSVGQARRAVAALCDGQALDHEGVALAVSEAVANAVVHAYPDGRAGMVSMSASLGDAGLRILVGDAGHGVTPRIDSPGMGLGLALIAHVAKSLEIVSDRTGTRLTMCFERGP